MKTNETNGTNLTPQELRALVLKMKADYHRAWSQANRDKVRKHQRDYWVRKALKSYQERGGEK